MSGTVSAEVCTTAVLYKEAAVRVDSRTNEEVSYERRARARRGQVIELSESEFARLSALGAVQVPGSGPVKHTKVAPTPGSRPLPEGTGAVPWDNPASKPASPEPAPEQTVELAGGETGEADQTEASDNAIESPDTAYTVEQVVTLIQNESGPRPLNTEQTVELAGGDAELARIVMEAEHNCGRDPREGVVERLQKVIDGE